MRFIDQIPFDKASIEAIRKESKFTDEQIETLKYELVGRALTEETNVLDAYKGIVRTLPLFQVMLQTLTLPYVFIITPNLQPLYNIQNKYMGFLENGKIRDLNKEMRIRKIKKDVAWGICLLMAFLIGLSAPAKITILFIIFLVATGYSSYHFIIDSKFRH